MSRTDLVDIERLTESPSRRAVSAAVRAWLDENWNPELPLVEWRRTLAASGWGMPSWPRQWHGRGLPEWSNDVVRGEILASGMVGVAVGTATALAAPTILEHGPDALRTRFLAAILSGEETWCQLFTEPAAGSDLAGLTTSAVLDGDHWIVNGQKVWTTNAHHAAFGLLVARTDWDAPKHRGLTYFALPMRQPGVDVRPLRQMNGHSSFNEVFLSDAVVPKDYVVGRVGEGWAVAMTTLAHERRFAAISPPRFPLDSGRTVEEARREADEYFATYKWYPQRAGRVDLVVDRAQASGNAEHLVLRQEIVKLLSMNMINNWMAARVRARDAVGQLPGAEGSMGKLAMSAIARQAALVHSMIAGPYAMLVGSDGPLEGTIAEILLSVPAQSIAGGTDEIQRNIVAEKLLGLPRDSSSGREVAFRDVPRNL
jgi:alkylation response protein AidB-like acyl-CoA dehydrogenase